MKLYHIFKRAADVVVSFAGIIVLIPLFVVLGVLVKSTSKGPVVYKHMRVGKDGKAFEIYKFRTMIVGARDMQKKGVPENKLITPAGVFLRKSFLDEILQLFNVLKGQISLVGPRPMDKEFFDMVIKRDKKWNGLVEIKPGITSLESVADYLPMKERIKFEKSFKGLMKKDVHKGFSEHRYVLDSYYIKNESLLMDLRIMFYTFLLAIKRMFSKI